MTEPSSLMIRVVYLTQDHQWEQELSLPEGTNAGQAIERSGLLAYLHDSVDPGLTVMELAMGVFGQLCSSEQSLQNWDRVEVYRPLSFDPMESRRRRYAHKLSQKPLRPRRARRPDPAPLDE